MDPRPPDHPPPVYAEKSQRQAVKSNIAPLPQQTDITKVELGHSKKEANQKEQVIQHQPRAEPQTSKITCSKWHHYHDRHRCHPDNVCYGCCFRPRENNEGKRYAKWYDPVGSGPLRVIGLLLFWLLCGPFFGCYLLYGRVRESMYRGAKWYNPVKAKPFLLVLFWLFCGPCFMCYFLIITICDLCSCLEHCRQCNCFCCQLCFALCWYDPDDIDYD